jgi:hypothetical protein
MQEREKLTTSETEDCLLWRLSSPFMTKINIKKDPSFAHQGCYSSFLIDSSMFWYDRENCFKSTKKTTVTMKKRKHERLNHKVFSLHFSLVFHRESRSVCHHHPPALIEWTTRETSQSLETKIRRGDDCSLSRPFLFHFLCRRLSSQTPEEKLNVIPFWFYYS